MTGLNLIRNANLIQNANLIRNAYMIQNAVYGDGKLDNMIQNVVHGGEDVVHNS